MAKLLGDSCRHGAHLDPGLTYEAHGSRADYWIHGINIRPPLGSLMVVIVNSVSYYLNRSSEGQPEKCMNSVKGELIFVSIQWSSQLWMEKTYYAE